MALARAPLVRFSARNFKSLAAVDVSLRPFNVLVGANGAGKTSVLEGLGLLSQLRYKKPATIFAEPRSLSKFATIVYGGTMPLRLDARKLARPSISSSEQPVLGHDGRGLPSVLADLAATNRERLDRIFTATSEIIAAFEGARMPRRRIPSLPPDAGEAIGVGLELELHGRWLDASLVSEGTLLVLGLMTIVHGLQSTRLLLMDDIERALHPKAQRSLAEQLAALTRTPLGLHIVCTTQSPYLLDAVDPEDVLVVRAGPEDGLTRCRRLVEHEAWDKWRSSMTPGEFWSYVGEDWLEAE